MLTEPIYLLASIAEQNNLALFSGLSGTLQKAIEYIDHNLFTIQNIDELCSTLFLNRAYFHRLFINSLGVSPMKYIKTKRLIAAQSMIKVGEKPTSVYLKVCYNDYTTFFRAYKSFFGYPPKKTK